MARGFSSCGSQALECRLSSCGAQALLLCNMWDVPGSGLEPVSPALAGGFSTTAPPGKPWSILWTHNYPYACLAFNYILFSITTYRSCFSSSFQNFLREFPGSPVVRTPNFHWAPGSIPGQGTKILQATQHGPNK